MSQKRPFSPPPAEGGPLPVYISEPIEDRGSTHIGLYSPTVTAKKLQTRADVKDATHRISAWRIPGKQKSLSGKPVYDLGHDDDGETHAGKKLERLLSDLNVEGAVVVARWYGGILLGPVRFTHFENCARGAISKWRQEVGEEVKKRKVEEDEKVEKAKLAKALEQRDSSIVVLRDLLAEKTSMNTDRQKPSQSPQSQETSKKTDYSMIDLPTLKRLEKARDGTLAWILKQIDKAEENQKKKEETNEPKVSTEEAEERAREFEEIEEESSAKNKPEEPS